MKTKFTILALVLCMISPAFLSAQPGKGRGEDDSKFESYRIAFITRKLSLTPDESKTFWPVYDKYQGELKVLRSDHRKSRMSAKSEFDSMSDKEIEKLVDAEIQFRQAELDLIRKYNSQFKAVLPIRKVAQLYKAEEDFKRELLKQLQERNEGGPGRR